jgi:phospho-N-acetylmuramoyl-pentapeptide-transferase
MAGQFAVTGIFVYYLMNFTDVGTGILIPFTGGFENGIYLQLPGWLFIIFMFVVFLGTANGTNFTDGLDGLLSSVTVLVAVFLTVVAYEYGNGLSPITAAVAGSLLGFLLFNVYPARVFMGDTGSLALGGFVAATASMMHMQLFIIIFGLIYLVEVISVMIQVAYFKKTGGKRFFKMAPIHHHFELCGWPETKVVAIFSIVTAILCLVGFLAL